MRRRLAASVSIVSLVLSACGANVLRLESASSVSVATTAVVDNSRTALAEMRARRLRANSVVVASDPSCPATQVIHIRTQPGPLCAETQGADTVAFDTRPISEATLQPTLLLIAALADYAAALADIVGEQKPDISAEIGALSKKAAEAKALADGLLGISLPDPAKALATKQAASAIKLVQFVAELSHEAGQVRRVRELVRKRDAEVGQIAADLNGQVADWLLLAKMDAQTTTGQLRTVYYDEIRKRPFDQRLAFVELVNSSRAEIESVDQRAAAMKGAIKLLGEARAELSRRLAGSFTDEEQRRIARIERDRLLSAVKLLAQAAATVI